MFEFNPKLLLFIPVSVVFYTLLSQKEEVNIEKKKYPYFENEKKFRKSLSYKPLFEKLASFCNLARAEKRLSGVESISLPSIP